MWRRSIWGVLAALAVAVALLAGCGADSENPEKAAFTNYLEGLRPAMESFVAANDEGALAVQAMNDGAGAGAFLQHWDAFVEGYGKTAESLNALDPPAAIAGSQHGWVASLDAQAGTGVRLQDKMGELDPAAPSRKVAAAVDRLYAQSQADQLDVVAAMRAWGVALQAEAERLGVSQPDWAVELMARIRAEETP